MKSTTQNIKAIRLQFGELTITAEVEARLEELGFTPETLIDAIGEHKSDCSGNPSIYCGTYGKYSGEKGICGLWIDLTTFYDYDDFLNFCYAIHADEEDPELMFQDYEAFPRKWYDESCFDEDSFDAVREYSDLCVKYSPDAVDAFIDWGCEELEHFEDCYVGEYDSEEDFAREIVNDCYDLEKLMGHLANYFDYKATAATMNDCTATATLTALSITTTRKVSPQRQLLKRKKPSIHHEPTARHINLSYL